MKTYLVNPFLLVDLYKHVFPYVCNRMKTRMNNSFEKYLDIKFRAKFFGVSSDWLVVCTCEGVRETNSLGQRLEIICVLAEKYREVEPKDWSILIC